MRLVLAASPQGVRKQRHREAIASSATAVLAQASWRGTTRGHRRARRPDIEQYKRYHGHDGMETPMGGNDLWTELFGKECFHR